MTADLLSGLGVGYRNRRGGLIFFGILEILIGLICVALVPLMVLGTVMAAQHTGQPVAAQDIRQMIPGGFFYLLIAVFFIWTGIGSILARRWARALMLVASWLWFLTGLVVLGFWAFMVRAMFAQMAGVGGVPPGQMKGVLIFVGAFLGFVYVLLPLIFLLFYRSRHVRMTCETTDPRPRWTDSCPLPVLAVSAVLAMGALNTAASTAMGVVPFFGRILTGSEAVIVMVVLAVLLAWLAVLVYRLSAAAWRWTVVLVGFSTASTMQTFLRVDIAELYQKLGISAGPQMDSLSALGLLNGRIVAVLSAIPAVLMILYLVAVRRFFNKKPA